MPEITDWRNRLDRYRLLMYKCTDCGKIYYMKRKICLKCGGNNLNPIELSKKGTLESFTVIRQAPEKFRRFEPYLVGIIKVEDDRIIAQLTDVELNAVRDQMLLEPVFRILYEYGDSGHIIYGIKFRPATKQ